MATEQSINTENILLKFNIAGSNSLYRSDHRLPKSRSLFYISTDGISPCWQRFNKMILSLPVLDPEKQLLGSREREDIRHH
jgi:hypothetical protein